MSTETGWQPIETAPKDGSLVRVKRIYRGTHIAEGRAFFGSVVINYPGVPMVDGVIGYEPFSETYDSVWVDEDRCHLFPSPTHWMPPTEPPR